MKFIAAAFVGIFCLISSTTIASADTPVTKAQALKAIDEFQKDPSSKDGFAAAAVFINFTKTSSAVSVMVTPKTAPWLTDKNATDADTRNILLSAYVAGSVATQLKNGRPGDDVYSGWEQVLNTYAQLLRINSAAKIKEVDDLKSKDADGSLRNYAAEVAASK